MTDVLEEVTGEIDREAVVERLRDWERRIRDLYAAIIGWLPPGWTSEIREASIPIHERMMRLARVPERRLPALILLSEGAPRASIAPHVLWMVGTNGRLGMRIADQNYFIVDRAQIFERPSWQLIESRDRSSSTTLNEAALQSALDEAA